MQCDNLQHITRCEANASKWFLLPTEETSVIYCTTIVHYYSLSKAEMSGPRTRSRVEFNGFIFFVYVSL